MNLEHKLNKLPVGLTIGVIVPILTLIVVYLFSFNNYTVHQFVYFLQTMKVMSKLLSLCVVPNLLAFFIFIWLDYLKSARGVLMATFIMAILVFVIPRFL